jgi:hypothetical protein
MSQPQLFDQFPEAFLPCITQRLSVTNEDWRRIRAVAAETRRDLGVLRASTHADRLDAEWRTAALDAVHHHAMLHLIFLAEDVHVGQTMPEGVDGRAWGSVMQGARRRGWIEPHGYAPANSSNRGPKVQWLSRVYVLDEPRG